MGPLIPLFRTSGDISSMFQNQSGQPYLHLGRGLCVTHSLRLTSGVTPADLLVASMAAEPISSTYLRAGIGRLILIDPYTHLLVSSLYSPTFVEKSTMDNNVSMHIS